MKFRGLVIAASLLTGALCSAQYPPLIAVDMHPPFADTEGSMIRGVSLVDQVGWAAAYKTRWVYPLGVQWTDPFGDLYATDGNRACGVDDASGRAAYWNFLANPPTLTILPVVKFRNFNIATSMFGGQFGGVSFTNFLLDQTAVATYWPMTGVKAKSQILHPNGYARSWILGLTVDTQVGFVANGSIANAAIWNGSANSFRNAHIAGYSQSLINGADATRGVGAAFSGPGTTRAFLWHLPSSTGTLIVGTPGDSFANAIDEDFAVGWYDSGTGRHAVVWNLFAQGTYFDLHNLLPGGIWAFSEALAVARNPSTGATMIGGYAVSIFDNTRRAFIWTSPSS